MSSPARPTTVAGHYVKSPSLVSVGNGQKRLVYAVSPNMIASVALTGDVSGILPTAGKGPAAVDGTYASVARPAEESISFISVHPAADLLCVGTQNHGLYLTKASSPVLSDETRLPLEISGERTYSGCFLHVPGPGGAAASGAPTAGYAAPLKRNQPPPQAPSSSSKDGATPHVEDDLLAFSSTFRDKKGPTPHRLSLYTMREKCLLWRGAMDPLDSISAFPLEWSFAACTARKVSMFTVQWAATGSLNSSQNSQTNPKANPKLTSTRSLTTKATLLSRTCSTVDDLQNAEYVRCVTDYHSGKREGTFVALTTNGYMVSLDKETGAVVRWMDCKVCPANSVQFAGPHVLVVGAMLRFFASESWEFCGKIKPDVPSSIASSSYLGKLLSASYTAAVPVSENAVALFAGSGEAFVYRVAKAASGGDAERKNSHKLQLQQAVYYTPVAATESRFLWVRPTLVDSAKGCCLWSPSWVRVYTSRFALRKALALDSTCAAYHAPSQVLLAYDSASREVAAYSAADDWQGCGRMELNEPFTCMAASSASELCAGYSESCHSLTVFSCAWKDAGDRDSRSLLLQRSWTMTLSKSAGTSAVKQIFFLGGSKAFCVTATSLLEADSGDEHPLTSPANPAEVVKVCPVGMDVVVLFRDRCAYYVPDTRELKTLSLTAAAKDGDDGATGEAAAAFSGWNGSSLVDLAYEPMCDLIAVCDRQRIVVARLLDCAIISVLPHDSLFRRSSSSETAEDGVSDQGIKSIDLRAGPTSVTLTVVDSMGHISEYTLQDRRIALNVSTPRGVTPRTGGGRQRAVTPPTRGATARRAVTRTASSGKPTGASPRTSGTTNGPPSGGQPAAPRSARGRARPEVTPKPSAKLRAKTVAPDTERAARRRAVSAQAPSNRELTDRLAALSGYYAQQKAHAQQLPPRTPRHPADANAAREATPNFPQNATPDSSSNTAAPGEGSPVHDVLTAGAGGSSTGGSAPPSRTRTANRTPAGVHDDRRAAEQDDAGTAGAGVPTSIAVSALTVPSTSSADGDWTGMASSGSRRQQPQPCQRSPLRDGDVPLEDSYVPYVEDEVAHSSTVPSRRAPAPHSSDDAGAAAAARQDGVPRLTALRRSLLELKDFLDSGSDSASDLAGSAEAENELNELPSLLTAVAEALRLRNERRSRGSSSHGGRQTSGTGGSGGSGAAQDSSSYQFLFAELQRIQKQNERLEQQNRAIMERLEPSPKR